MKLHKLIFSDSVYYRYQRHGAFWLVWWFYFVGTFFYAQQGFEKAGSIEWICIIFMKSFSLIVCHAFITYMVIYLLILKYWIAGKYTFFVIGLVFAGVAVISWAYLCYLSFFPLLDKAFNLPSAITSHILLWSSISAGLISALKVMMAAASIKLLKRWWVKQKEKERLAKEHLHAELQLLKAQIHPDLLFSSLDQINDFSENDSKRASEMLLKLSEILSYMLYECDEPYIPVEKEIKMIRDYITLEEIRMQHKLETDVSIKVDIDDKMIAPLILLPFIDNNFSFCCNQKLEKSWINIDLQITEGSLSLKLVNGVSADILPGGNVDDDRLINVRRRLDILYPDCYEMKTTVSAEIMMTSLKIRFPETLNDAPNPILSNGSLMPN